jgi:CBS-domain-containing membrane protein
MRRKKDVIVAPLMEGVLILVISFAGWISHNPLVFASLGPTAFEMIETPERPSARPYNVIVGNLIAVVAAFAALWLTDAWDTPGVSASGVPLARVWAGAAATMLTVFGTLLACATQPAALSTTLLISLGIMQTAKDGVLIMAAVLLMVVIGEPVRRWRVTAARDQRAKGQA